MSITLENVSFAYGSRRVLEGLSFALAPGQLVSVLGPNGAGKSTLFRCILGLLHGYTGRILLDGQDIRGLRPRDMSRLVAYIPQVHRPSFHYTVYDMVLMGASAQNSPLATPGQRARERVERVLAQMLLAEYAQRDFLHLSGGEQQLVLIARALAQESSILVMDEPTANLDYGNQLRVLSRIRHLAQEGYTVVQSTHNPDQAALYSHRVLALHAGKIAAEGAPQDVITPALMQTLYGIDVRMESLPGGQRVCVPTGLL